MLSMLSTWFSRISYALTAMVADPARAAAASNATAVRFDTYIQNLRR